MATSASSTGINTTGIPGNSLEFEPDLHILAPVKILFYVIFSRRKGKRGVGLFAQTSTVLSKSFLCNRLVEPVMSEYISRRNKTTTEGLGMDYSPTFVAVEETDGETHQFGVSGMKINTLEVRGCGCCAGNAVWTASAEAYAPGKQVPGRRCPTCAEQGQTVWVIPGRTCPYCFTEVN